MDKLGRKKTVPLVYRIVFENLKHRLARTILTALAISLGVAMILTIVGLSEGMMMDQRNRARGAGADIMILPTGMSAISLSTASIPEKMLDFVRQQPHVEIATGAVMQPIGGIRRVTGIDYKTFASMAGGFKYLAGGPMTEAGQTVIDEFYAEQRNLHVGDKTEMLDRDWEVAGIIEPGKMARLILPIEVVQDLTGTVGKLTLIYVKLDDPKLTDDIVKQLQSKVGEKYQVISIEEFASQFSADALPELRIFIDVIIIISVFFGFLIIFLTMHTAVLERTREIGILKSLGASQGYILGILVREALTLGALGSAVGILLSFGTKFLIDTYIPASMQAAIVPGWWPTVVTVTLVGALLGAIYPALKAARQDALESLAYD